MERSEIVGKLTGVFRRVFNDNSLVLNNELTANDIQNWDSLSHVLLITAIEETFSIKFKFKDLHKFNKVGDMIDTIDSKIKTP